MHPFWGAFTFYMDYYIVNYIKGETISHLKMVLSILKCYVFAHTV